MAHKRITLALLAVLLLVSAASAAIPPTHPFQTNTYSGVSMVSATATGNNQAVLVGSVSDPGIDPGWFMIGPTSGGYSYYTNQLKANGSGYFTTTIYGMPLIPGKTYYVRAATSNGRSATELNFNLTTVDPVPTFTYGIYWDEIQESNKTPLVILGVIPQPIVAALSGYEGTTTTTNYGWSLFWLIIFGVTAISYWLRQNEGTTVLLLFTSIGMFLWSGLTYVMLPNEFSYVFCLLSVAIMGGVFYHLLKRDN